MTARGMGDIVNIASTSGTKGTAGATAYAASKWARCRSRSCVPQALQKARKGSGFRTAARRSSWGGQSAIAAAGRIRENTRIGSRQRG
ncbi:MAG: SDR family NAD(P)-dependent oxidoreductase [Vicinamibacterales bacterium]